MVIQQKEEERLEQFEKEVNRYFNIYGSFCSSPSNETVNDIVSSAYRCNEKLKKASYNRNSFGLDMSFFVLRALRNHFTHSGDLDLEIKGFNDEYIALLKPELLFVCLIPRKILNSAINMSENYELSIKANNAFQQIGDYVDIHPFIFNFSVKLFEKAFRLKLDVSSDMYSSMKESYKVEKVYGEEHFVKYNALDLSLIPSNINGGLTSFSNFTSKNRFEMKKNDVGTYFISSEELKPEIFDIKSIIDHFVSDTKTLNGKPIKELPSSFFDDFDSWSRSKTPSRLKSLLKISDSDIHSEIGNLINKIDKIPDYELEMNPGDNERFKILKNKRAVIENIFIELLNEHYHYQFNYVLFLALMVLYGMASRNNEEFTFVGPFIEKILIEEDEKKINRTLWKVRENRTGFKQAKSMLIKQIFQVLIEHPYDDYLLDSII